jgi:hypothetical protein
MATQNVQGYQKRTKTGQLVQVRDYQRQNTDAAVAVADEPGRPPMAGTVGQYAKGRSIPGWFPDPDIELNAANAVPQPTPGVPGAVPVKNPEDALFNEELAASVAKNAKSKTSLEGLAAIADYLKSTNKKKAGAKK